MEMIDREKVIKEWEAVLSRDPLDVQWDLIDDTVALLKDDETQQQYRDDHIAMYQSEIKRLEAMLKEQEAKEQCLKTKCIICPHCEHCDVDENGLLKEQQKLIGDTPHWIFGNSYGHAWMKCSNCCVSQSGQTACWSYCPNCGTRMEGQVVWE